MEWEVGVWYFAIVRWGKFLLNVHRAATGIDLMLRHYSDDWWHPLSNVQAFLSCLRTQQPTTAITMDEMQQQIENTKQLTRKSFFPSSSSSSSTTSAPSKQLEFNFDCYAHFKVYNEILIKSKVNFPPFQKEYNSKIGKSLFHLVQEQSSQQQLSTTPPRSSTDLVECIQNALYTTDSIASFLQRQGMIETWERSIPPSEDIEDFSTLSSDLTYSLALNGDITLNSQLLLQELGYRMYPALGRWLIYEGVSHCFNLVVADEDGRDAAVRVQVDDYYMDTNYNSNPDLFEVKQILLSIVIQRDWSWCASYFLSNRLLLYHTPNVHEE